MSSPSAPSSVTPAWPRPLRILVFLGFVLSAAVLLYLAFWLTFGLDQESSTAAVGVLISAILGFPLLLGMGLIGLALALRRRSPRASKVTAVVALLPIGLVVALVVLAWIPAI